MDGIFVGGRGLITSHCGAICSNLQCEPFLSNFGLTVYLYRLEALCIPDIVVFKIQRIAYAAWSFDKFGSKNIKLSRLQKTYTNGSDHSLKPEVFINIYLFLLAGVVLFVCLFVCIFVFLDKYCCPRTFK